MFAVAIASLSGIATAQKIVQPPEENASMAELQKWIIQALPKYASYKTRSASVVVSEVKVDGCTIKFVRSRKVGTTTSVTEGARRTVSSSRDDVTLDARDMRPDAISLSDHLYPELQTLGITRPASHPPVEIVLKRFAAEAVRSALAAAARRCSAN